MEIGDFVKFLNAEGKGKILSIHGDSLEIEDEFGFTQIVEKKEVLLWNESLKKEEILMDACVKNEVIEIENKTSKKKNKNAQLVEVDLHFGQLVDYPKRYSKREILQIQLRHAQDAIENHRNTNTKLILIHGKGKGILENEIQKLLKRTQKIKYKDADFQRYKLGAVEITYV